MAQAVYNSRWAAFKVLEGVLLKQPAHSLNELVPQMREQTDDGAFMQALAYGVCRYWNQLEATANHYLQKKMKAKDRDVVLLMAMGIFQLHYMRVPDHAAINETVGLVKSLKKPWAKGVVNGVLRNFQRKPRVPDKDWDLRYAHPDWMINRFKADWKKQTQEILAANNANPPFCVRVNQQYISREQYSQLLTEQNLEHELCEYATMGIRLATACDVTDLPHFDEGWVSVQDEAAQLVAPLFGINASFNQESCHILDACSAPGGKTLHLAECYPQAHLVAMDCDERRLQKVAENIERAEIMVEMRCADVLSEDFSEHVEGEFHGILLDAPCSGTGVIRRNPDIKWLRTEDDIDVLAAQQLQMLMTLWEKLPNGGRLLYSTCSILKQENEEVVAEFMAQTHEAQEVHLPEWAGAAEQVCHGRQWLPADNQPDGFYLCLLEKSVK